MSAVARKDSVDSVFSPDGSGNQCGSPTTQSTDQGSGDVFCNGIGIVREGDPMIPHPGPGCGTHAPTLSTYSSTVFVNGKRCGRLGDEYGGHIITSGSGDVFAGDTGGGGGGDACFIEDPTINVLGAPNNIPLSFPTLSTSAFSVNGGTDTHVSTDWKITRVSDGVVVFLSPADTQNLLIIVAPVIFTESTSYLFEARHNGAICGSSAFAIVRGFTVSGFS